MIFLQLDIIPPVIIIDALIKILKNIKYLFTANFEFEDSKGQDGKIKAGEKLAELFDTYPPKKQKGGTVTTEWLDSIHRLRYGKRSVELNKHEIAVKLVAWKHKIEVNEHLSAGSTVGGGALWMIYDNEIRRRIRTFYFSCILILFFIGIIIVQADKIIA